jgi:hypothetical protein
MEATNSSINIATILLIGMGGLIVLSLITLAVYFFGGPSPLERNALGRIENAVKPEDALRAERQFRGQRLIATLILVLLVWGGLYQAAPAQTEQATVSFFQAVGIAAGRVQEATKALLHELGIGNER